ncbi:MAG: DUF1294 domain-containing protein [Caldilineaceae bacterium]|nr:DUF1294 domain-containing protein [Caldilineaceae bacterium]
MQGEIIRFDPAKGFGFIKVAGQEKDIFIHQSEVNGGARLRDGMQVEFETQSTAKGLRAVNVRVAGAAAPAQVRRSDANPYTLFSIVAIGIVVAVGALLYFLFGWFWLLNYLIAINLAAFGLYGYDKSAAQAGGLRVPERVLHGLELFGGTPGAFIAQRVFHHKTRKVSYRIVFWLIFAVQVAVIAWWFWPAR